MPKKERGNGKISRVQECSDFFFSLKAHVHAQILSFKQNDDHTCRTFQHRNRLSSSVQTGLKASEIPQDSLFVQIVRPV